ncbi:sensor histidine kinase [Arundinibacter roseus]|uniref:histidine kinase n=1 Tax=Arundinibacter roseus TaxID=2070510 RepID=A0A4R4KLX2_9BACT|nr:sensor histidine kinase [Arundinibacter roseus]TDB67962.1 histidine kinase [Arundinibacter roseus]
MENYVLIGGLFAYLGLLFGIAYFAEKRSQAGHSLVNNPYVYALSLAVYCTAWTYYGSVGNAATQGPAFLTTYLGPLIMMPLWWIILRKMIRISKIQRISSIADFISARYGKSKSLGMLVTGICMLVIVPYISLQLKAISLSFYSISSHQVLVDERTILQDIAFYSTLFLALFTILFGARRIETTERHEGLVMAIALESLVKLVAFVTIGVFVTYGVFNGFGDIFTKAARHPEWQKLLTLDSDSGLNDWFWQLLLAMATILFLPRQFQMAVVENVNENHLRKALWIFPLYLLLINFFVVPIALGGNILFEGQAVNADNYVLAIPLFFNQDLMAMFSFLGGFAAATGMIIVETTALSVMLSNNLLLPLILSHPRWRSSLAEGSVSLVLIIRRVSIAVLLLIAYLYYDRVVAASPLVSIGLVSFVGVAQFAPAMIGGLFWKRGNRTGAILGLVGGILVWMYTLVVPTLVSAGFLPQSILIEGPFQLHWLRPDSLLGLNGLSPIAHALFWSLLVNCGFYIWGALRFSQDSLEHSQAVLFVDVFTYSEKMTGSVSWQGQVLITDIESLLSAFLGKERSFRLMAFLKRRYGLDTRNPFAEPQLVTYAEQVLAGAIGTASARIMVSSVTKEERITVQEVVYMLKESQELIALNRKLDRTSKELKRAGKKLSLANEKLKKVDKYREEFISTVTHEIRTPLTSIRAFSEILYDNPDMGSEEKEQFLGTIIKESERLTRLINQVLDLEKIESGKANLIFEPCHMPDIIREVMDSLSQLAHEKGIKIESKFKSRQSLFRGDRDRMTQVLINLVSNAIKFCEKDKGYISVESWEIGTTIWVSVIDNGPGIEGHFQSRIFEKFYQAQDKRSKKPSGSGLGLAITKKIIELHQGTISVESKPGFGACFLFQIPTQPEHNP